VLRDVTTARCILARHFAAVPGAQLARMWRVVPHEVTLHARTVSRRRAQKNNSDPTTTASSVAVATISEATGGVI